MNNNVRVLAVSLMLCAAPILIGPASAQQSGGNLNLERSIGAYQGEIGQMKRRELRAYIQQFQNNIDSTNRAEYRAKIRLFKAELRSRKVQKKKKQIQPGTESTSITQASANDKAARRYLKSARPSGELNRKSLKNRISRTQKLLQWKGVHTGTRKKLETLLLRDRGEYAVRTGGQQSLPQKSAGQPSSGVPGQVDGGQANQIAESVLSDKRNADRLTEKELRVRLQRNRRALRNNRLDGRYSKRMRQRLARDRRELRRRLNARRTGQKIVPGGAQQQDYRSVLLGKTRPAHGLRTPQLSLRVQRTRHLLARGDLSYRERNRLLDLQEGDRRELRQRLRHRRDRRRGDLSRWVRNNEINIVIAPSRKYAPRDDIEFAEVEDEVVERQLIAPARRKIERRYSFDEYRRRPDLRHSMPAIDVDSINFGFNESFVREEEIEQLERLGAVLERIVAKHPKEVFLIEGHTDAVGSGEYNLVLSEKRAEAIRSALLEYFVIEPRNLTTIGYGEQFLKIHTQEAEEENRRVSIRRITPLLAAR